MRILRNLDRLLMKFEGWLIVLFLSTMVSLTFFQVILRAFYTHAQFYWANAVLGHLDWAEPLVRLLVLWITFLGASLLTGDNKHIKIDLMSAILPPKWITYRELILALFTAVISSLLLKASIEHVSMEMAFGGALFLQLPSWIGQLILPIGFSIITFRFLLRCVEQAMLIWRGDKL
jgi:TRAP-type C4-dicarboxylate transport system permease small subunit